MRTIPWLIRLIVLVGLLFAWSGGVAASPHDDDDDDGAFPSLIRLPDGFSPEGIAVGRGASFYVGSIPTGAVYRGDLRTGQGAVLVPAQAGRLAIGLKVDRRNRLFVAGGSTGQAYVYNAATGATLATYQLTTGSTFINDVIVTPSGAWFTDSFNGQLYRLPIAPNGTLGGQTDVQTLPLSGDIVITPGFNVNGIVATPNGTTLIIVQSNTGKLFTVDPTSGVTRQIDLGGGTVLNGDGLLLHGKTLYVVQNTLNQVAVVRLRAHLSAGSITAHLTNPALDIPTTIARFGDRLYVVNARFFTPPTPTTRYDVVQLHEPED